MNKVLPHPSFFPQGRRGGGIHLTIITIMCRQILFFLLVCVPFVTFSQETSRTSAIGWPEQYTGVMLQGFSWDNYSQSRWVRLERQAKELAGCFDLVWIPNSGYCAQHNNMGYLPLYYWNQNSSFGTEAELRSLIRTFQQNGIATIADVVINHHNTTGWFGFPQETYKGETYQTSVGTTTAAMHSGKPRRRAFPFHPARIRVKTGRAAATSIISRPMCSVS